MRSLGFKDIVHCIEWLKNQLSSEKQIADLAYHLTIGETYFFRDSRFFHALETQILPGIIDRRRHERIISIWSAGCCSGEETYSLAILLHRLLPDIANWNIRLIGSDINQEFLRKAEIGRYHRWSFRTTPKEIQEKYFIKDKDNTYLIAPEVQQLVNFRYANLVDDDRPETSYYRQEMDLVICNNVLIYFSQKQIDKTIHRLVQALVKEGWLTVTPVEAPFVNHPQLIQRPIENAIFFQKSTAPHVTAVKQIIPVANKNTILLKVVLPEFLNPVDPVLTYHFANPSPNSVAKIPSPTPTGIDHAQIRKLYQAERYHELVNTLTPHLGALKNHPIQLIKTIPDLLLLIRTYSNLGDFSSALEWCEIVLLADSVNPVVQYLKAEIKSSCNDVPGALHCLRKALFLDPDFVAALYLYGQLERKCGQLENSERAFKQALSLIDAYPLDEPLPGTEEVTAALIKDHLYSSLRSH